MPKRPTPAQIAFLERMSDHTRHESTRYRHYYWMLGKSEQKMLKALLEEGLLYRDRDYQNYFVISEKGWDFLVARGFETPKQYRSRRRREGKERREEKAAMREREVQKNLSQIDEFLADQT